VDDPVAQVQSQRQERATLQPDHRLALSADQHPDPLGAAVDRGYGSNAWATYKQVQAKGAQVRGGQKSTEIVFIKKFRIKDEGTGDEKQISTLRSYRVFKLEQIDGLTIEDVPELPEVSESGPVQPQRAARSTTGQQYPPAAICCSHFPSTMMVGPMAGQWSLAKTRPPLCPHLRQPGSLFFGIGLFQRLRPVGFIHDRPEPREVARPQPARLSFSTGELKWAVWSIQYTG
jgi:hypothetical protein